MVDRDGKNQNTMTGKADLFFDILFVVCEFMAQRTAHGNRALVVLQDLSPAEDNHTFDWDLGWESASTFKSIEEQEIPFDI